VLCAQCGVEALKNGMTEHRMFFNKEETVAQFIDRFLRRIAFAVLLMSISFVGAATSHFVEGDSLEMLEMVRRFFGLAAAIIVLPMFIKMMRIRWQKRKTCEEPPSGYIADIYGKSAANAFAAAFLVLIFTEPFADGKLAHLPPAFFLQAALAVMLGALGISFFILSRDDDDELDDDFESDFADDIDSETERGA